MRVRAVGIPLALVLSVATQVRADGVTYGPDGAPTVVQNKLHRMSGLWEVGLAGELALDTALVDQRGALLSFGYHPNEWLDVGADAMLNATGPSGLTDGVRAATLVRTREAKDEFRADGGLRLGLLGTARVAPIYGKLNLASELRLHFQAYVLGGAGAVRVHRESVNLCTVGGSDPCPGGAFATSDVLRPAAEVGAGFRFWFGQDWSLRAELRGFFFRSSYLTNVDLTQPGTGVARPYLAHVTMFALGVSRTF